MINLTKINGERIVVNAELIEHIESIPDTLLVLTTDRRIMVSESVEQVVDAVVRYRKLINGCCCPCHKDHDTDSLGEV
jgi:flagellar protein FlbD